MKREVKIGVFAVAMILAAWAGIRFLKGFDIFGRNTVYYAAYDQIAGVQAASPVQMQGVKIGTVTGITLDPRRSDKVILQLTIKRQYLIPEDSEAKIISSSLMGAKAIEIIYGASSAYLEAGDTLRSGRDRDLMDMAGSELDFFKQKFSRIADDLSRTLDNVNLLLEENATNISGTLGNLNSVSGDVAELLETEKEHLHSAVQNLSAFVRETGGRNDSARTFVQGFRRSEASRATAQARGYAKEQERAILVENLRRAGGFKKAAEIHLTPTRIDPDALGFDDAHINTQRAHHVTEAQAKQWIRDAKISVTVWGGRYEHYYAEAGAVYVNLPDRFIRTAFSANEYTDNIHALMEAIKENGL